MQDWPESAWNDIKNVSTITLPKPDSASKSICSRCLTLLSHAVILYSDGSEMQPLDLNHSSFSAVSTWCLICNRASIIFNEYGWSCQGRRERQMQAIQYLPKECWYWGWEVSRLPPFERAAVYRNSGINISIWARHDPENQPVYSLDAWRNGSEGRIGSIKDDHGFWHDLGVLFCLVPSIPEAVKTTISQLHRSQPHADAAVDEVSQGIPDARLIQHWLDLCIKNHTQCRQLYSPPGKWLPDRLIFYDKSRSPPRFRLISKDDRNDRAVFEDAVIDADRSGHYIALSHCWGPPVDQHKPHGGRVVLTTKNIAEWSRYLPISSLPKTHIQALELMVSVGIRFMWIDSLCILQDSEQDWLIQSALMSDVYKHAVLTFAALSAMSDEDGLFHKPTHKQAEFGFYLPIGLLGRYVNAVQSPNLTSTRECSLLQDTSSLIWRWQSRLGDFPLHKRAWVYQERQLSRRTVGIESKCIAWACDELTESQLLHRSFLSGSTIRSFLAKHEPRSTKSGVQDPSRDKILAFMETWYEAAFEYANCGLTMRSDALMAISAVARELARGTDHFMGRYLGGLWEYELFKQLEWMPKEASKTDVASYVAPSWSWLSINGPTYLSFPYPEEERDAKLVHLGEVVDAQTTKVTDFEFGRISGGVLRVCGHLHGVASVQRRVSAGRPTLAIADQGTGVSLPFYNDVADDMNELMEKHDKLRWMPHNIFLIEEDLMYCTGLVLMSVNAEEGSPSLSHYRRVGLVIKQIGRGSEHRNSWSDYRALPAEESAVFNQFASYDGPGFDDLDVDWQIERIKRIAGGQEFVIH